MATPPIDTLRRADWEMASGVLARAFQDDPILTWIQPHEGRRARAIHGHFAIECRDVMLRHGRSLVARGPAGEPLAAMLVAPPSHWRMPLLVQAVRGLAYTRAFGLRLPWALGVQTSMEGRHPSGDHVYLPYIGVLPEAQGTGTGSALLTRLTNQCDHDGMPAYLEASSPRNAPLYRRFGFETREVIRPLGAPPIELMWRDPR